jgi:hypothetical protein
MIKFHFLIKALTYNLISGRIELQNNCQPEHRFPQLFESPQMLTSHNISRPNSSCSLNSNGSREYSFNKYIMS